VRRAADLFLCRSPEPLSPGLATEERDELSRLRRENKRLQADVDLLKRATAFFAKKTR
jgi:transposase